MGLDIWVVRVRYRLGQLYRNVKSTAHIGLKEAWSLDQLFEFSKGRPALIMLFVDLCFFPYFCVSLTTSVWLEWVGMNDQDLISVDKNRIHVYFIMGPPMRTWQSGFREGLASHGVYLDSHSHVDRPIILDHVFGSPWFGYKYVVSPCHFHFF